MRMQIPKSPLDKSVVEAIYFIEPSPQLAACCLGWIFVFVWFALLRIFLMLLGLATHRLVRCWQCVAPYCFCKIEPPWFDSVCQMSSIFRFPYRVERKRFAIGCSHLPAWPRLGNATSNPW